MNDAELRERVARAIQGHQWLRVSECHETADRVLAALGLDDPDAAVERIAVALVEAWEQAGKDWLANRALREPFDPNRIGVPERWMAEKALAALTPPKVALEVALAEDET